MSISVSAMNRLQPQTGCAFILKAGETLEVISPCDEQVADLALFARADPREYFSSGRTLDYNEQMFLTTGAILYSNRSTPLMRIELDEAGRHDYLITPCSSRMFEILYKQLEHPSCQENLTKALERFQISSDGIHSTFNAFMRIDFDPTGHIAIMPPSSRAGDRIVFKALIDLICGLTSCSSELSNNNSCKPIDYRVIAVS
jgi:uncharacterized protein YcgI (DUF1989 family)